MRYIGEKVLKKTQEDFYLPLVIENLRIIIIWIRLHDNVTNDIRKLTKYDFYVKDFSFIIV